MDPDDVSFTLTGADYSAPAIYDLECERIFHRQWFSAFREELVAEAGQFRTVDVAGESVIVVRGRDGDLHAHRNVCRHRGARLCDEQEGRFKGAIKCPYHAWSYAHDGALIGTPNVEADDIDRAALSLWQARVAVWEGCVFVSLAESGPSLEEWLGDQLDPPLRFASHRVGTLRIGQRTSVEVAANWKILIDNYHECLHCPTVHPELVALVPTYRSGSVSDDARDDAGVALAAGSTSFTHTGRSVHPVLPGLSDTEAGSYYGCVVFPNMLLDLTGTSAIVTTLVPTGPASTTVLTEYLFTADEVAAEGFDPSDVVSFSELVGSQDYAVCERVQRGVSSRAFTRGVLTSKDAAIAEYNARYLRDRGDAPGR